MFASICTVFETASISSIIQRSSSQIYGVLLIMLCMCARSLLQLSLTSDVSMLNAGPVIALAMGERGVASRILAPKYGTFLTFGALSVGKASASGQPLLTELKGMYALPQQSASTQVSLQSWQPQHDSQALETDFVAMPLPPALRGLSILAVPHMTATASVLPGVNSQAFQPSIHWADN